MAGIATATEFTPHHLGGSGPPLVCLHGFTGSWHAWELVLDALESRHTVFAPTLPGHRGGPPLPEPLTTEAFLDAVEAMLDTAGIGSAHLVGNSLGGFVALRLAARGRADSVVALAPAGGWASTEGSLAPTLQRFSEWQAQFRAIAPHADSVASTTAGRRRILAAITERVEHVPPALAIRLLLATATCPGLEALNALALREHYTLNASRIACPVRIVWGENDRLLAWPQSAARYRSDLPRADWVILEEVGHCPQLDVPLQTAQLILGHTALSVPAE